MNEHPSTTSPERPRRRGLTLGVAAGLVAGGAIGLAATMPSSTSAASDSGDEIVALQTNDDDGSGETGGTTDERPEPGTRLREALQPLVDDGTIDDGQADAVAAHLVENRPERDGREGRGRKASIARHASVAADLIGIETAELRAELEAGASIAEVAEANGVDPQVVVDGLVADAEAHAQMRLDHGADEERVAERLQQVTERIEEGVFTARADR